MATPKDILSQILDVDHVEAFLAHRKSKKAPLTTELAAKIIVKRLVSPEIRAYFPDPNQAIEEIIERGWQTIKAEWLQPRQNGRTPARGLVGERERLMQEISNGDQRADQESGDHHALGGLPERRQLGFRFH